MCSCDLRVLNYKPIPADQIGRSVCLMAPKYVIGTIKKEMASITSHWQHGYNPLHFCESGSDTSKALALALGTEAVFTRTSLQKGTDGICSAGLARLWLCQTSISFPCPNSQVLPLSTRGHLCRKDLKRTTTTTKLTWAICVFLLLAWVRQWWQVWSL